MEHFMMKEQILQIDPEIPEIPKILDDDVLILDEKDLVNYDDFPSEIIHRNGLCCAKTKKGSECKNKVYKGKDVKLFCKRHIKQYSLEKPSDCPVCMEPLTKNDHPIKCGHWIHNDCLMKCKADTCPMCRTSIKFTKKEKEIRNKLHPKNVHNNNNDNNNNISIEEIYIPEEIFDFISSFIRGVPEDIRDEFLLNILNIGDESIVFEGNINDYQEDEFNESDIEDFPDFIDFE